MKFLQQIAEKYAQKLTNTAQLLFVFPNRRAGLFFKKELLAQTSKTVFAPEITDINSFVATLSPLKKANDIELLFNLYESYTLIRSKHIEEIESIDTFIPFGITLLGDFNEIDKYLVDTKLLFSNIANIKGLNDQSQFLSEQQREALKAFWSNIKFDKENKNLSFNNEFISLWDDLYDIYSHFTQTLIEKKIGYDGLIYRTAIEQLEKQNVSFNKYKTICFIGFNSLTTSEYRIFQHFKKLDIADFYFDYPQQYAAPSPFATSIAKYYNRNLKEFPSKYAYTQPTEQFIPNITLHNTPSITNQVNIACSILSQEEISTKPINSTAILLSDESLMPSLIQQLPKNIEKINITMGYPLSITPVATLVNHIMTLQTELTKNKNGELQFYHKPLISILSHSSMQGLYPNAVNLIINQITRGNYIRITAQTLHSIIANLDICEEEKLFFTTLFTTHDSANDLLNYLQQIIDSLLNSNSTKTNTLQTDQEFLYQYNQTLRQLARFITSYSSHLTPQLLRLLINRLTSSLKVQFKGEPVEGMQIMGLLESRLLDFDNIIILGFNDSNLPGNKSVNSIIPYNLRRAYNLPTVEDSDAIQAYNFYRTLYHCKNIHLIYDSRTEGAQNEISRYYYQMKYLLNAPMKEYSYTLPIKTKKEVECNNLVIEKTQKIQQKLDLYKNTSKNTYSLSASRIKDYITCPLKFYYNTVVGIKKPNEINEKDDVALLGRIYHHAMEAYYETRNIPDKKISDDEIKQIVNDAFVKESIKSKKQINTSGFNALTFNIVSQFIKDTIQFDLNRLDPKRIEYNTFEGVDSEVELHAEIQNVKFIAYVDRIDYRKNDNIINIIDYKTTLSKSLTKVKLLDIFTSHKSEFHEVFQVLLYCYMYSIAENIKSNNSNILIPYLYKIYDFSKPNTKLSTFKILIPNELNNPLNMPSFDIDINSIDNSKENSTEVDITNYKNISVAFEWLMNKIVYDIYNPTLPFSCNPLDEDHAACKYCQYQTICKKES